MYIYLYYLACEEAGEQHTTVDVQQVPSALEKPDAIGSTAAPAAAIATSSSLEGFDTAVDSDKVSNTSNLKSQFIYKCNNYFKSVVLLYDFNPIIGTDICQ